MLQALKSMGMKNKRGKSMGIFYYLKCNKCDYNIYVKNGYGRHYYDENIFYGCNDKSIAFQYGYSENEDDYRPLLTWLAESEDIREKSFSLLADGATASEHYEHKLYVCPKCKRLANLFDFMLASPTERYRPDHRCQDCSSILLNVEDEPINENGDGDERMLVYRKKRKHCKISWMCPDCSCSKLIMGEWGLWD